MSDDRPTISDIFDEFDEQPSGHLSSFESGKLEGDMSEYDAENVDIEGMTHNDELRELIETWRERGVEDPYGMNWNPPANELEELIE